MGWPLKKKLVCLVLATVTIVSMFVGIVFYRTSRDAVMNRIHRDCSVNLEKLVRELDNDYETSLYHIRQVSIDESVQNLLVNCETMPIRTLIQQKYIMSQNANRTLALSGTIRSMLLVKDGKALVWTALPNQDERSLQDCQDLYNTFLEATNYPQQSQQAVSTPIVFQTPNYPSEEKTAIFIQTPVYNIHGHSSNCGALISVIYLEDILSSVSVYDDYFDAIALYSGDTLLHIGGTAKDPGDLIARGRNGKNDHRISIDSATSVTNITAVVAMEMDRLFLPTVENIKVLFLGLALAVVLLIAMLLPPMLHLTKPVAVLTDAMKKIGAGDLETRIDIQTKDEFETLGIALNKMVDQLDQNIRMQIQANIDKQNLEYEVLVAQINPHFIYNTLNTVIYLARKNRPEDVEKITRALISLLQDGIKLSGKKNFSTIEEEFWILHNYVYIQNYRYQDRFHLVLDCPEELLKQTIPTSIIQPLVENALFHGIVPLTRSGTIQVRIRREGKQMLLQVCDDGIGLSEEKTAAILADRTGTVAEGRNHVGIANILHRLKLLYADDFEFQIRSREGEGTTVEIRFLCQHNQ